MLLLVFSVSEGRIVEVISGCQVAVRVRSGTYERWSKSIFRQLTASITRSNDEIGICRPRTSYVISDYIISPILFLFFDLLLSLIPDQAPQSRPQLNLSIQLRFYQAL